MLKYKNYWTMLKNKKDKIKVIWKNNNMKNKAMVTNKEINRVRIKIRTDILFTKIILYILLK